MNLVMSSGDFDGSFYVFRLTGAETIQGNLLSVTEVTFTHDFSKNCNTAKDRTNANVIFENLKFTLKFLTKLKIILISFLREI